MSLVSAIETALTGLHTLEDVKAAYQAAADVYAKGGSWEQIVDAFCDATPTPLDDEVRDELVAAGVRVVSVLEQGVHLCDRLAAALADPRVKSALDATIADVVTAGFTLAVWKARLKALREARTP